MNKFIKYTCISDNIKNVMMKPDCKNTAEKLVKFFEEKKEKYTYNEETKRYYISSFFPTISGPAWNRFVSGVSQIVNNDKRIPMQADLVVTGRCHCHCWHCFRAKYKSDDMNLDKIKECMESLYKLGTATVGITGGEPMLRSDIYDIIKMIPNGMEGQLYTTGYKIDDEFAKKIKGTNLTRCVISLDHYDEDIVCKLRNNPNAFKDAINAVKVLTKHNIYTAVTICIKKELLEPGILERYFEFINSLGVQEMRIIMQIPQGNLEGKNIDSVYMQAMNLVKNFRNKHIVDESSPTIVNFSEVEGPEYFGCTAGFSYISVNNDGAVTPCVAVPLSFGNVYEDSLENIYYDMDRYFRMSSGICFGIASQKVISAEKIDTAIQPLSMDKSFDIATKCKIYNRRADIFEKCAERRK